MSAGVLSCDHAVSTGHAKRILVACGVVPDTCRRQLVQIWSFSVRVAVVAHRIPSHHVGSDEKDLSAFLFGSFGMQKRVHDPLLLLTG